MNNYGPDAWGNKDEDPNYASGTDYNPSFSDNDMWKRITQDGFSYSGNGSYVPDSNNQSYIQFLDFYNESQL